MEYSIKNRWNDKIIVTVDIEATETTNEACKLGLAAIAAVKKRANLYGANLSGANLSGANLSGADLYGANLFGANRSYADLRAYGNMKQIKTLQFEKWEIGYTKDQLQIGCQRHEIEKWRKWNTEAGRKWVSMMDGDALEWAEKWLDLVLTIIDKSPAEE